MFCLPHLEWSHIVPQKVVCSFYMVWWFFAICLCFAGAFGYFEVTHDITQYTKAVPFNKIGKRTPIGIRFSTVGGESGSADTVRDPRGFAVKFYTEDGNWDLVGNNTPIFFIRDPILFPSFIHTQKRNPQTHLKVTVTGGEQKCFPVYSLIHGFDGF